jgi:hypothetical protein
MATVTVADFAHSRWDSTYESPSGPVRAIVRFDDDKGAYDLVDGSDNVVDTGVLQHIKYFITSSTIWLINGTWAFHGDTGAFQFNGSGGPDDFTGGWFFTAPKPGGGTWDGHRLP